MKSCVQLLRAASIGVVLIGFLAACASGSGHGAKAGATTSSSPRNVRTSTPSHPPTASRSMTQTHVLDPAGAVAITAHGSCFTSSITVTGAYRCFVGDEILDPCFGAASAKAVVCYVDPWTKPTAVRLTKGLPGGQQLTISRPWAIQLAGGIRCVASTGVVLTAGKTPLTYVCGNGGGAALTGTGASRTARYRPSTTSPLRTLAVTDVWA